MVHIALVGNCQASALSAVLKHSTAIDCRHVLDVNGRGSKYVADVVFKIYNKTGIDHLLSQPMSDEFDDVSSKRLKAHYQSRFANYTNIYFSGLHPDLTYFGGFGQRVTSPLGDYHSRIILACFFQGRSVRECLAAFNGGVYEKLGYFLQFEHSLAELARRDEGSQIKFAAHFAEMTRTTLTMLSVNHPTLETMVEFARVMEAHLTDRSSVLTPSVSSYPLATGPIWPLYPELREQHRLPYETTFDFHPAEGMGPPLCLEDFVLASYESYEKQGLDALVEIGAAKSFADLPVS